MVNNVFLVEFNPKERVDFSPRPQIIFTLFKKTVMNAVGVSWLDEIFLVFNIDLKTFYSIYF